LAPNHEALAQQEEQADTAAANDIQQDHGRGSAEADGVISRAHFLVTPRKRFRDFDEMLSFG
jgi:hypothetical protein